MKSLEEVRATLMKRYEIEYEAFTLCHLAGLKEGRLEKGKLDYTTAYASGRFNSIIPIVRELFGSDGIEEIIAIERKVDKKHGIDDEWI